MSASSFESEAMVEAAAVGLTEARRTRFWLRTTRPGRHVLRIAPMEAATGPAREHVVEVPDVAGADGTHSFAYPDDVPGAEPLEPLTFYRWSIARGDGVMLEEGWLETAPASPAEMPERVAFAFGSCHQPFDDQGDVKPSSMRALQVFDQAFADHRVRRLLLIGDQMYADWPEPLSLFDEKYFARVAPPGRASILECTREEVRALFQQRYRIFWQTPSFRRMAAHWPTHMMLDDHEVVDNFGSLSEHASPEWAALRAGALDAYHDYAGIRVRPRTAETPASSHHGFRYGTVACFLMDLRSQRRVGAESSQAFDDDQLQELTTFLEEHGDAHVAMVVLPVPLVHVPRWMARLGDIIPVHGGDFRDRWTHPCFDESRHHLVRALRDHHHAHPLQRLLLLGGDIHVGEATEIRWEGSDLVAHQLVSSAISNEQPMTIEAIARHIPRLGTHLDGGGSPYRADCRLMEEACEGENPFAGLNAGIIEIARRSPTHSAIRFRLIAPDDGDPPRPRVVLTSSWIE